VSTANDSVADRTTRPARRVLRRVVATGVALLTLAAAVLAGEAGYVATRSYLQADSAPPVVGSFGPASGGPASGGLPGRTPLRLVMVGDSTAAGVGASETAATVGALLAAGIAATGRAVTLSSVAVSGSRTTDLADQVRALAGRGASSQPDLAVVLIGANDATHLTSLSTVSRKLSAAVRGLHAVGAAVVVAGCPDLGAARAFPQPLRLIAAARGRAVAATEHRAAISAGATFVDLAREAGPAFRADPRMLSTDRFHPSDRGYARWARALLPALRAGLA
jgi:lysophospholipase L1-like esterase